MEENQVSRTALNTAYVRGCHATHDEPKIFDDFYSLFKEDELAIIEQSHARALQYIDPVRASSCPDQATAMAWSI